MLPRCLRTCQDLRTRPQGARPCRGSTPIPPNAWTALGCPPSSTPVHGCPCGIDSAASVNPPALRPLWPSAHQHRELFGPLGDQLDPLTPRSHSRSPVGLGAYDRVQTCGTVFGRHGRDAGQGLPGHRILHADGGSVGGLTPLPTDGRAVGMLARSSFSLMLSNLGQGVYGVIGPGMNAQGHPRTWAKASSMMSRPSSRRWSGEDSGGRKRKTLPKVPAVRVTSPWPWQ